jgi:hypothetical protein
MAKRARYFEEFTQVGAATAIAAAGAAKKRAASIAAAATLVSVLGFSVLSLIPAPADNLVMLSRLDAAEASCEWSPQDKAAARSYVANILSVARTSGRGPSPEAWASAEDSRKAMREAAGTEWCSASRDMLARAMGKKPGDHLDPAEAMMIARSAGALN